MKYRDTYRIMTQVSRYVSHREFRYRATPSNIYGYSMAAQCSAQVFKRAGRRFSKRAFSARSSTNVISTFYRHFDDYFCDGHLFDSSSFICLTIDYKLKMPSKFIRILRTTFCYKQLCGRCLVHMTPVVKVVIHCVFALL